MKKQDEFREKVMAIYKVLIVSCIMVFLIGVLGVIYMVSPDSFSLESNKPTTKMVSVDKEDDWDKIENGIHIRTGLKDAEGLMAVVNNCTNCHSAQLVMENRMNEERWIQTIRWMQETQNLWDLGKNEKIIVDYLVTNYPIINKGRRENLNEIEWYTLDE
ncbi:MAG: monoheme cytochrome C [Arenibacter sp.]|nr:monoheme cytochrome C [Arenibacter sp.]